jgi:DNA-binding GntR family transcriptional regulator
MKENRQVQVNLKQINDARDGSQSSGESDAGGSKVLVERQSDQAFEAIRGAITQCELAPAEIVSEPQLEQMFGFGRIPIRLAMDRLIQLQLVKAIHRRGYEIAPITLTDVKNTFQLRLMVEPAAVRMAAGRVNIEELRRADDEANRPVDMHDKSSEAFVINANRRLHLLIAEACGNDKIVALISQLLSDIDRVYYFGLVRDSRFVGMQHSHKFLIDALEAGDGAKAERLARKHIENGYSIVLDAIINSSNLTHTNVQLPNRKRRTASGLL